MLTRYLNIDQVYRNLAETINENDFNFDWTGNCKYMHLKHFFELKVKIWPAYRNFVSLRDTTIVYVQHRVDLQTFDTILARFLIWS